MVKESEETYIHIFYGNCFYQSVPVPSSLKVLTIGREEPNDIICAFDELISRNHARISFEEDYFVVEDLGSKNGVFYQTERVGRIVLPFEKKVSMGQCFFVVSRHPFKEIKQTMSLDDLPDKVRGADRNGTEKVLEFLHQISQRFKEFKEESAVFAEWFEVLKDFFGFDRLMYFEFVGPLKKVLLKTVVDPMGVLKKSFSQSVLEEIRQTERAVFIQNVLEEVGDKDKSIRSIGVSSLVAVPVRVLGKLSGVLQVEHFSSEKAFEKNDFYMLCLLSELLSLILSEVGLREQFRKEKECYWEIQEKKRIPFLGSDPVTEELKAKIDKVAPLNTTVLIIGESGTGKEVVAQTIHALSLRYNAPFVVINCAALPEHLLESELFGHVKGAFTGANQNRTGKCELANRGTLFLDEIGEMPLTLQAKLLRFLESREVEPLGTNEVRYSDVRILSATNRDLKKAVEDGKFREDLYYRLSVFPLLCPPLRERKGDISVIAEFYLKFFSREMGKSLKEISVLALDILKDYSWPGNIRELKNVIEHACVLCEGEVLLPSFLPSLVIKEKRIDISLESPESSLERMEKEHILKVLKEQGYNKSHAAKCLGITRKTLYGKMRQYGIRTGA